MASNENILDCYFLGKHRLQPIENCVFLTHAISRSPAHLERHARYPSIKDRSDDANNDGSFLRVGANDRQTKDWSETCSCVKPMTHKVWRSEDGKLDTSANYTFFIL